MDIIFFITLEEGIKKIITEYTLPYSYPKNKKIDSPFFEWIYFLLYRKKNIIYIREEVFLLKKDYPYKIIDLSFTYIDCLLQKKNIL